MKSGVPFIAVLSAMCVTGCTGAPQAPGGTVCTAQFVYGLAVTVNDASTGRPVCDAQVTAVSGSYRETLLTFGSSANCSYAGAGERPGVYDLAASKAGYTTASQNGVRVVADECHVIPARVTLDLKPPS